MGSRATHWQDGMTTTSPFRFFFSGPSSPRYAARLESAPGQVAVKPMADLEISHAKRRFRPRVTFVNPGTRATFPNFNTVRHHACSFSPIKTIERTLCAGGPGGNIHDPLAASDVEHHAQLAVSVEP